jgi:poly(3-hydroxybutyrate) depolymerase
MRERDRKQSDRCATLLCMKSLALGCLALVVACSGDSAPTGPDGAAGDATADAVVDVTADAALDQASDAPQTTGNMSFTSGATCNPSPCAPGTAPSASGLTMYPTSNCPVGPVPNTTNVIGLGAVTDGVTTHCRMYGYYRPKNLVGNATAVFTAGGAGGTCGNGTLSFDSSYWYNVANANHLVVIALSYCPSNGWTHPYIDVPDPGTAPTDGPYLDAVVKDAAANKNIGIDTSRMILTGGSSGGTLTLGVACDPTYSTLFQGYASVSSAMNVPVNGGMPVNGQERCSSANKHFFMTNIHGTADGAVPYAGACIASHCITSFAETESFWSGYLGCSAHTTTPFGTPQTANLEDDYSGCGFGLPPDQAEGITVTGGGHQHGGLDAVSGNATNGFNTAQTAWDFFSSRHW